MGCVERLTRYLKRSGVEFDTLPHRITITAERAAHSTHVPRRQFAKVVMLRVSRSEPLMAILRADEYVDIDAVRRALGRRDIDFASEEEIYRWFPDCEVGAMPPFSRLWHMPAILDASFNETQDVYFQAGNHHESVRMSFADFRKLAGPFAHEAKLHVPLQAARS